MKPECQTVKVVEGAPSAQELKAGLAAAYVAAEELHVQLGIVQQAVSSDAALAPQDSAYSEDL